MIICCRRSEEMLIKINDSSLEEANDQKEVIIKLKSKIDKKKNELDLLNRQLKEYNELQEELVGLDKKIETAKRKLNELIEEVG